MKYVINGIEIPMNEREKIRHEVNSLFFSRYENLKYIAHRSVGFDGEYYIYLIENLGFDDYCFLARYINLDDEDDVYGHERI